MLGAGLVSNIAFSATFVKLMKYQPPHHQGEFLPNLLGLQSSKEIALLAFEGFLKAEIVLTEALTKKLNLMPPTFLKSTNWL